MHYNKYMDVWRGGDIWKIWYIFLSILRTDTIGIFISKCNLRSVYIYILYSKGLIEIQLNKRTKQNKSIRNNTVLLMKSQYSLIFK